MRYGRTEQLRSAIRHCQSSVAHVDFEVMLLQEKFDQAEIEIDKLSDIIDELRDENANMQTGFYEMVKRGGFDISPCMNCGESVVCIPEGLALCKRCAAKGGDA